MATPYDKLSVTMREALALHDIINTHGVPVDKIFVSGGNGKLYVVARDGEKEYTIEVGEASSDRGVFMAAWNEAVSTYNESSMEDRARLLNNSRARENAARIVAGLVERGFEHQGAM